MDLDYFKKTFKLDSTSSEPMYKQISNYLKRMIQMGILKEGDQMIPEVTICNELNVSRSTVRLAMAELLDEGLLVRYRGKGSYVADNRMKRPINYLYNFTESMHDIGAQASSVVLNAEVLSKIPEEVREKLINFAYETRISSTQFCEALCSLMPQPIEINNNKNDAIIPLKNWLLAL